MLNNIRQSNKIPQFDFPPKQDNDFTWKLLFSFFKKPFSSLTFDYPQPTFCGQNRCDRMSTTLSSDHSHQLPESVQGSLFFSFWSGKSVTSIKAFLASLRTQLLPLSISLQSFLYQVDSFAVILILKTQKSKFSFLTLLLWLLTHYQFLVIIKHPISFFLHFLVTLLSLIHLANHQ